MSEAKPTPGPWSSRQPESNGTRVTGPFGITVSWCGVASRGGADGGYSIDKQEAAANARLISAALETAAERDELLAALKAIANYPVQSRPPGAPCSSIEWAERQCENLIKIARAAIAKAEKQP